MMLLKEYMRSVKIQGQTLDLEGTNPHAIEQYLGELQIPHP